jgi:hypothetical protein
MSYPVTGASSDGLWWRLTCFDEAILPIDECWVSADPSIAMATDSTALTAGSEIKPYIELTFDFLRAIQSGLTAAGSAPYLSRDLQSIVESGRPLPTLFGVQDSFPSFVMTDFSDPGKPRTAQVRIRFNYESPTYAIVTLVQEEDEWQIDKVAAHNLVKSFSTGELLLAEDVIIDYYDALAANEPDTAFDLLTAEMQEDATPQTLASSVEGLKKLAVSSLQPVRSAADQIVYYVRLLAAPDTPQPAVRSQDWRAGENARWLTLFQTEAGWRIAQIVNSPILADITSWQRVNVPPINMNLDIPADWTQAGLQFAWSPDSLGSPAVGVNWVDLVDYAGDEAFLPRSRKAISSQPVDLGWAQGTQHAFEVIASSGEGEIAAETHIIVQTGHRAYDFYAAANTSEELENMRPILQRMVAAVTINDPSTNAYKSVETSVNFLATLLRDETGTSALPYLSEDLGAELGNRESVLPLLGVDALFESFSASWIDNTATGQARVGIILNFADATERVIFTVQRGVDDTWRVVEIEPVER